MATTLRSAKATVAQAANFKAECEGWSASRLMAAIGLPNWGRQVSEQAICYIAENLHGETGAPLVSHLAFAALRNQGLMGMGV